MHRLLPLAGLLLLAPLSLSLFAQPGAGGHNGHGRGHAGGMAHLDADQDGRISRAEFDAGQARMAERHAARAAKADKPAGAPRAARAPVDFKTLDVNRDGYVVRTELRAHHERMRPQREAARKARFDAMFTGADLNRDGRLGRVEVDEKLPRLAKRFAWLDDNRDGFLSRAELAPRQGR